MIPLIIGPEEQKALRTLKEYALAHPLTMEALQTILESDKIKTPVQLHEPGHYCYLPRGFEVGLTYELQKKPVWHLSMSLHNAPGRVPHPAAVGMVLMELGLPSLKEAAASEMIDHMVNIWFVVDQGGRLGGQ